MTTLDELLVKLLWHVEQVCGPLATEPCVADGDDDRSVLAHNFRATLADALEAAALENERMREALAPFAAVAERDIGDDEANIDSFRPMLINNRAPRLTVGNLRAARNALSGGPHE